MSFIIVVGNIVDNSLLDGKDAIVLPTNPKMRYGMGVSEAIFRKAGINELEHYCEKRYGVGYSKNQIKNDMKPTECRITPGFNIGCDIIFVQSPNNIYFSIMEDELYPLLSNTYKNLLSTIKEHHYKNIIMPSLGTGHYGFDHKKVAEIAIPMINAFLAQNNQINITLCLFDSEILPIYEKIQNKYHS